MRILAAMALGGVLALPAPDGASDVLALVKARAAAVHNCAVYAYYPNVRISSARNMTCRAAARDMRRYRRPIYRRFWTPGGFLCAQQSGSAYGGQWRCVSKARAYRFEFAD